MKVLIVGAGMGGLTLAAFLERCKIEYDIVEKCPDWGHVGYLISMWDSGRDILRKLGVAERFDAVSSRVRRYSLRRGDGTLIRDIDFSNIDVGPGTPISVVSRCDLHELLRSAMQSSKIRMNCSIEAIENGATSAHVKFTDGTSGTYDLVVGADGVHSKVRELLFGGAVEVFEDWRVWYAWIDHEYDIPATIAEYAEAGEFAAVFSNRKATTAWFFAPATHGTWDAPEGRIKRLKEIFKDEQFLLPALEKLHDTDAVPSDLSSIRLTHWSRDRAVLIGDAAHCMGPYAGVGSTLAMEDAYVLASEIARVSSQRTMRDALEEYEEHRKKRIRLARKASAISKFGMLIRSRSLRRIVDYATRYMPQRLIMRDMNTLLAEKI